MQQPPLSPGQAAEEFYGMTVGSLILIAVAAVVVIIGILYGMHLARSRHAAEDAAEERAEENEAELPPGTEAREAVADAAAREPAEPEPVSAPSPEPAPMPKPAPSPDPVPQPVPTPAPAPLGDDRPLTTIKGLGPKVAGMLGELGITRIDQIAALSAADAEALDAQLGAFTGRMARDRWIDQATLLSAGDTAAYEAEFGKLG